MYEYLGVSFFHSGSLTKWFYFFESFGENLIVPIYFFLMSDQIYFTYRKISLLKISENLILENIARHGKKTKKTNIMHNLL